MESCELRAVERRRGSDERTFGRLYKHVGHYDPTFKDTGRGSWEMGGLGTTGNVGEVEDDQ